MITNNSIDDRVDQETQIPEDIYLEGLVDIVEFLCLELNEFLISEGRYLGITKSYMNSINESINRINSEVSEEDMITYGKILYLYKPIIKKEFKRLRNKRLSLGDSTIVIIKKLLDIIIPVGEKPINFRFYRESKTIKKVILKFFDNIKNYKKNDSLYQLSYSIKTYMPQGIVGKYSLDSISLLDQPNEKVKLDNPEDKVLDITENLKEVEL